MTRDFKKSGLLGTVAVTALAAGASAALAGGFAIREQSAESQGASFAGNAASTSLGAMYWNPAAAANKSGPGINTESNYSFIVPKSFLTVDEISGPATLSPQVRGSFAAAPSASDIGKPAIVPASYASYQLTNNLFLGLSLNSGFGLKTEPREGQYDGAVLGRTSSLFTTGASPTFAYVIAPGITIGAGAQINYAKGVFKFATGLPQQPTTSYAGEDFGFGATAGILLQPAEGTRIGLGWRSAVDYQLEGTFNQPTTAVTGPGRFYTGRVDLKLPDIATLSLNQAITKDVRLLGTFEWTNWSRFQELRVRARDGGIADVVIPANWQDGYFFSVGTEYDYSKSLTWRAGFAYEISPIGSARDRLTAVPDADRYWLSSGLTYKLTQATTIDVGYSHVFIDDSRFLRDNSTGTLTLGGSVQSSSDIFTFGMKSKF